MGNYKVECVLHQTNKQNSARARRTKNTYSSKVHPIYGCTLCSFTEPFSGASGGRARRARRALVRVSLIGLIEDWVYTNWYCSIIFLFALRSVVYSDQSPSRAPRACLTLRPIFTLETRRGSSRAARFARGAAALRQRARQRLATARGHQRRLKRRLLLSSLLSCFAAARAACVSTWLGESVVIRLFYLFGFQILTQT